MSTSGKLPCSVVVVSFSGSVAVRWPSDPCTSHTLQIYHSKCAVFVGNLQVAMMSFPTSACSMCEVREKKTWTSLSDYAPSDRVKLIKSYFNRIFTVIWA